MRTGRFDFIDQQVVFAEEFVALIPVVEILLAAIDDDPERR